MVSYMKTTIHIPDSLLAEVRKVASEENTTLKALTEEGLRLVINERRKRRPAFKLRDESFDGEGLQAPFSESDWGAIRAAIYEGRGG
jgi:hypothetical protein